MSNLSLFGLDIAAPLSLSWYGVVGSDAELRSPYLALSLRCPQGSLPHDSWIREGELVAVLTTGACWRTSCPAARNLLGLQYIDLQRHDEHLRLVGNRLTGR